MINYNDIIVEKVVDYVKSYLPRITTYDKSERTIELDSYHLIESSTKSLDYYKSNSMTCNFEVELKFNIYDKEGNLIDQCISDLLIPKLINNLFVIDGSIRTPSNSLVTEYDGSIYNGRIQLSNCNFEYKDADSSNPLPVLFIQYRSEDWSLVKENYPLKSDEEGDEILAKYSDKTFITDKNRKKFAVALNQDLDTIPDHLTIDLIKKLRFVDRDCVSMKTISTVSESLMNYLYNGNTRRSVIQSMRNKFYMNAQVYTHDINKAISKFFRIANESNISIPSNVNSLVYDAQPGTIKMSPQQAYTAEYADIIDPVNTPENNNVNKINEINYCINVTDEGIEIKCYEYPSGSPTNLIYLDYLNALVLANSEWDYENNRLLKDKPSYKVLLRTKLINITKDQLSKVKFIEPKADDKLSITSRILPIFNGSDSIRNAMGASMAKQAIELDKCEDRIVSSGNEDVTTINSALITRHTGDDSEVIDIDDSKVVLKSIKDGSIDYVQFPEPIKGLNDTLISFTHDIKLHDKIKKGDIISRPTMTKSGNYQIGVNGTVFYMNYLGYTHEDAIVISESFANKLATYRGINLVLEIKEGDIVTNILKIGTKLSREDRIVTRSTKLKTSAPAKNILSKGKLLDFVNIKTNNANLDCPNNIVNGYIADLRIDKNPMMSTDPNDITDVTIEKYLADPGKITDQIPKKYINKLKPATEFGSNTKYIISIYLVYRSLALIANKLCNSYGSKGEISLILPDDAMPRTKSGTVAEVIMSPMSIIARKNTSQLFEVYIAKVVQKIYELSKEAVANGSVDQVIPIIKKYYGSQHRNITIDEVIDMVHKGVTAFKMNVGCFCKININTLKEWLVELKIEEYDEVFIPDVIINDGEAVSAESHPDAKGKYYELGVVEKPIVTGINYIYRLYHAGDYSGTVTPQKQLARDPLMRKGKYRYEGQKWGEMELWGLQSYGVEYLLTKMNPSVLKNQYVYLNHLCMAGYMVTANDGSNVLSPMDHKMKQLKELIKAQRSKKK